MARKMRQISFLRLFLIFFIKFRPNDSISNISKNISKFSSIDLHFCFFDVILEKYEFFFFSFAFFTFYKKGLFVRSFSYVLFKNFRKKRFKKHIFIFKFAKLIYCITTVFKGMLGYIIWPNYGIFFCRICRFLQNPATFTLI